MQLINTILNFKNSWRLLTKSLRFFWCNMNLLMIPLFATVFCSTFLNKLAFNTCSHIYYLYPDFGCILVASTYFFIYFIIIFFNAIFISCAINRMQNKPVSFIDSFYIASQRVFSLMLLAVIGSTLGALAAFLENSNAMIQRIMGSILGASVSMITLLMIPILVTQDLPLTASIKKCTRIYKQTPWQSLIYTKLFVAAISLIVTLLAPFVIFYMYSMHYLPTESNVILLIQICIPLFLSMMSALNGVMASFLYVESKNGVS
jgi:hypothetical protein